MKFQGVESRAIAGLCLPSVLATVSLLLVSGAASAQSALDPPPGLPYKGLLNLQLGATNQVTYDATGVANPTSVGPQQLEPLRRNDCRVKQPSSVRLLDFTAATQGNPGAVGLVSGSMGVYSGSQGTPCSRIDSSQGHELNVVLGSQVPANAFYRLELDIEAKGNLEMEMWILRGGQPSERYRMRTGSSIVAGQGSATPGSPDRIFNCPSPRAGDSGPDAGALDNCRWIVDDLGDGFRLKAIGGLGSLEGGADTGVVSHVYLTEAEIGVLGCGPNSTVPQGENTSVIGDGQSLAQCAVTRIDPTGFGGQCTTPIGYIFRNLGGSVEGCELLKSPGEQLAASIAIVFPPEVTAPLGAVPLTEIEFSDGQGGTVPFTPDRCMGTVVLDSNGNRTIAEVLQGTLYVGLSPLTDLNDAVPGNGSIDWACILDNDEEYLGPEQAGAVEQLQVGQTILFWGDIAFSRQAAQ